MSGLIVIFSALGGTTGSIITGNIFQHYGGQTAFYFSLVPITVLIISLIFFNRLQKKAAGSWSLSLILFIKIFFKEKITWKSQIFSHWANYLTLYN